MKWLENVRNTFAISDLREIEIAFAFLKQKSACNINIRISLQFYENAALLEEPYRKIFPAETFFSNA